MAEPEERVNPIPAPARRDSMLMLVLLGVTALLYLLSVPWTFAMVVTGPASAFFGARALYRSRTAPGIAIVRVWLGVGIVAALMSVLVAVTSMVFADVLSQMRDCMDRAVTRQAQAQCEAAYQDDRADAVEDVLERLGLTVSR